MAFGDIRSGSPLTASVNSVTNPTSATGSVVVQIGDLIFVNFGQQTNLTAASVTDNLGNTYSAVNSGTDAGTVTIRCFYARVTVGGTLTQVDVAASASTNDASCVVSVIEGPFAIGPLDANPANTTDGTSPFTCPATGTLAQADEVVMAAIAIASNQTVAATSPSVLAGTVARNNASTGNSLRVVTATTTVTPEFTGTDATAAQTTASFKKDLTNPDPQQADQLAPRSPAQPTTSTFYSNLLLTLLAVTTAPIQPIGWDNPAGRAHPNDLRTWTQSLQQSTLASTITVVPRAPTYYRYTLPGQPTVNVHQNILNSLLAPVEAAPFFVTEWPNPRGAEPATALRTWTDPYKLDLEGQDSFFGLAGNPTWDWPVPKAAQPSIILKTWTDPYKLNLAGQDRVYGDPGQVPTFVLPNPWGPQHPVELRTWAQSTYPEITFLYPLSQYDWPVPKSATPAVSLRTWTERYRLDGQDLVYGEPGQVPTFVLPNPSGPQHPVDLRSWLRGPSLAGQDRIYGGPGQAPTYDWQNPRGPAYPIDHKTLVAGFNALATLEVVYPVTITFDWPNPRGYVPSISLRTWVDWYKLTLIGRDRFFGLAGHPTFDWPNPKGYVPAISLRTWTDRFKQHIFFGLAGNPTLDWPVPKVKEPSIALRTWLDPTRINLIGQDRFFGLAGHPTFDWPVPKGYVPAIDLRTWTQSLYPEVTFLYPHAQYDWPVPKGPVPGISLRTWSEQLKLLLIGQDQFFGLAGNPTFDWPVPKGAVPALELRTWTQSLFPEVLFIYPHSQLDWPVPKGEPSRLLRGYFYAVGLVPPLRPASTRKPLYRAGAGTYWRGRTNVS